MSRRPWYKRYGGDFVLGTMALSLEEKGAYSLCLDLIYDRGGPIPDDPRWLAGMCGVSLRKWTALRERLIETGKLEAIDGKLANSRADRELAEAAEQTDARAENGRLGGLKKAENAAKRGDKSLEIEPKTPRKRSEIAPASNENSDLGLAYSRSQIPEDTPVVPKGTTGSKDFDRFWGAYPAKVGKKAARRAWDRAKDRPPISNLLAALDRYRRAKPADRDWCHPSTWLNEGRWDDGEPSAGASSATPPATTFDGPANLRAQIVRERDEEFARRWLDHYCRWRESDRTLIARNPTVAAALTRDLAGWLKRTGVKVEVDAANDPRPDLFAQGDAA